MDLIHTILGTAGNSLQSQRLNKKTEDIRRRLHDSLDLADPETAVVLFCIAASNARLAMMTTAGAFAVINATFDISEEAIRAIFAATLDEPASPSPAPVFCAGSVLIAVKRALDEHDIPFTVDLGTTIATTLRQMGYSEACDGSCRKHATDDESNLIHHTRVH